MSEKKETEQLPPGYKFELLKKGDPEPTPLRITRTTMIDRSDELRDAICRFKEDVLREFIFPVCDKIEGKVKPK